MRRLTALVLVGMLAATAVATPLLGRSATVNKPFQLFGWVSAGYNKWAKYYDWDAGKYVALGAAAQRTNLTADVTLGVGLLGGTELDVVMPLAVKSQDTLRSAGIGDVMVYARYGLLQSSLLPVKVALLLGANLPTADKKASPTLGDRTIDYGVALSTNTSSLAGFVAHARLGYWFNGKTNDTTKLGNMFEYNLTLDYSITKALTPELALSGFSQAKTEVNGDPSARSEVSQHSASLLLLWKPLPFLVIRPKVSLPLEAVSEGSSLPAVYGGLDVWVTLP